MTSINVFDAYASVKHKHVLFFAEVRELRVHVNWKQCFVSRPIGLVVSVLLLQDLWERIVRGKTMMVEGGAKGDTQNRFPGIRHSGFRS